MVLLRSSRGGCRAAAVFFEEASRLRVGGSRELASASTSASGSSGRGGRRKKAAAAAGPQRRDAMESLPKGKLLNDGRYRLEREINRGATAVVYEGKDTANGTVVALKVMNSSDGHMSVPLKIVKREVEYASTLRHDNIVRLLDVFAEGKQLILVWELISGPDLLDLLNECGGRMPEEVAGYYFWQLLKGVVFMHDNGFCHRDLKPENCMIDKASKMLKIIDFGLSKHLDSANTLGIGTPDYMCPELLGVSPSQPSSGPRYDAKAVDVWAMGVMLYLLVTGVYPFEDPNHPNSLSHTLQNVRAGRMRLLPSAVSEECGQLIKKMLTIDSRKRIKLQQIMEDSWLIQNAGFYAKKIGRSDIVTELSSQKSPPRTESSSSVEVSTSATVPSKDSANGRSSKTVTKSESQNSQVVKNTKKSSIVDDSPVKVGGVTYNAQQGNSEQPQSGHKKPTPSQKKSFFCGLCFCCGGADE